MGAAQLVALGGLAVGSVFGMPQIGFIAGSLLGNVLFAPKGQSVEGPRMGDLTVSSSAYGAPRTIGFGTVRQAGNIIWSSGIIEKKKKTKVSGGKGEMASGPSSKQTTYSYFASFAQAFGDGPADDVLRIWADSKMIYDKTGTTLNNKKAGLNFRFYPGTETQLPDPSILAKEGEAMTPAFRGTVMIVFDNLPLADFGNRIPNITAEISYDMSYAKSTQVMNEITGTVFNSYQNNMLAVDFERGYAYALDINGSSSDPTDMVIRKFNIFTNQEVQQIRAVDSLVQGANYGVFSSGTVMIVAPNGDLILTMADGPSAGNSKPIARLNGNTLTEVARFGTGSAAVGNSSARFESTTNMAIISLFGLLGREDFLLTGSVFSSVGVLNITSPDSMSHVWNSDEFVDITIPDTRVGNVCGGKIGESFGDGYVLTGNLTSSTSSPIHIYRIRVSSGASMTLVGSVQVVTGIEAELILTLSPSDLFPGETHIDSANGLIYDETDDTIMFASEATNLNEIRWFKYNPNTGSQVWKTEPVVAGPNISKFSANSRIQDGTFGYIRQVTGNNVGFLIDTQTGELLDNGSLPGYTETISNGLGYYDSRTETFVGIGSSKPIVRYYFRRGTANETSVGDIIKSIAGRVGLELADLDTTDVDPLTTPGYLIGRQTSARAAIQPLLQTYFFDGFENDDQLVFLQRGGESVRTITQDEFASVGERGEVIKITRMQEVELPLRVSLLYMDKDTDYEQNTHTAKRIQEPAPAMKSDQEMSIEYPGALSSTFAKQQVEKALYTAWAERNNYEINTPWTHSDLTPGDVITLQLSDGTQLRCRITTADLGADLAINLICVGEDPGQYVSSVLADSGQGFNSQTVRSSVYVFAKILDTPLLRDADEIPGRASNPIYTLMGSAQDGAFLAGTIFKSDDGVDFNEAQFHVSEMNWGTTINALPNPTEEELWSIDQVNTLTVRMTAGASDLESVTQLQMLNGSNAAALLKHNGEVELLQFQDVTENADGSHTLSNILRGRRGTDTMVNGHVPGETFILLIPGDIEKISLTLGERNAVRYYKSVGSGQLFENAELKTLTSSHRALMPYAVAQIKAEPGTSDSIDFSWVRRTRVGGQLQDGFGDVPLNEDSEEYEIDIYDGPGGSIVRAVTGLSTPDYNYTSANQTSDGFTPPISSVTIRVYQISAQVGRGFSREVTLNVE